MNYRLAVLIICVGCSPALAVTIDVVTVGNPGNAPDMIDGNSFGHVSNTYQIGRFEITNSQYVEFLNSKAASDPLQLFYTGMSIFSDGGIKRSGMDGSYTYSVKPDTTGTGPGGSQFTYTYGDKPVNYITWYNAVRFANWVNNGQGAGNTESGAYTIVGNTPVPANADSITRNAGALWFLPSENEWFKAAYYNPADGSYYDYPTSSNTAPNNGLPATDTGNSANHFAGGTNSTGDLGHPLTPAGDYVLSHSPSGTRDQGGNVAEWTERYDATARRGIRGGAWNRNVSYLSSATQDSLSSDHRTGVIGFRLAKSVANSSVNGDFNGNGIVDASDYVQWRNGGPLQNDPTAGVQSSDYNYWRSRFGATSGAGASVPEASSVVLLSVCAAGFIIRRHAR